MTVPYTPRADAKRGEGSQPHPHLLSKLTSIAASSTTAPYPVPIVGVSHSHTPPLHGVPPPGHPPTMFLVRHGKSCIHSLCGY